ncbi:MAG: thioredoxin family protein [Patescibacteria group bacterium]|nr:thioredoxin family protein [Patescibacteria group bacterium]
MKIEVLGSGCTNCKKLYELTNQAVRELNLKAEVDYVTDIQRIVEMGIMQSPVLAIEGVAVMTGATTDLEKIKEVIQKGKPDNADACCQNKTCHCNSGCC